MAMFLGHTAFMFELSVFVAGLVLWHFGRQGAAPLLRAGALVAIVGAALGALCTGYYMVRYQIQGDFDYAHPPFQRGMKGHEMMQGGGMGPGMMREMMKERMRGHGGEGPPAPGEPAPPGHEEHHPPQATE